MDNREKLFYVSNLFEILAIGDNCAHAKEWRQWWSIGINVISDGLPT